MEYLEYFNKYPDAYQKIVASFDRIHTLHDYLIDIDGMVGASSIFSIGPGDGAIEVRLAKENNLKLGVVEPSSLLFEKLRSNVASAGIKHLLIEENQQSFEDYESEEKYDCVLSLYSWFAFGFDTQLLEKALRLLNPGGLLVICLQSEKSPSTQISSSSRSTGIDLTSEALSTYFKQSGFGHQYLMYDGGVAAETYIGKDGLTELGKDLVSFLNATPWNDLNTFLRKSGFTTLRDSIHNGQIRFQSGCLVFRASDYSFCLE